MRPTVRMQLLEGYRAGLDRSVLADSTGCSRAAPAAPRACRGRNGRGKPGRSGDRRQDVARLCGRGSRPCGRPVTLAGTSLRFRSDPQLQGRRDRQRRSPSGRRCEHRGRDVRRGQMRFRGEFFAHASGCWNGRRTPLHTGRLGTTPCNELPELHDVPGAVLTTALKRSDLPAEPVGHITAKGKASDRAEPVPVMSGLLTASSSAASRSSGLRAPVRPATPHERLTVTV